MRIALKRKFQMMNLIELVTYSFGRNGKRKGTSGNNIFVIDYI